MTHRWRILICSVILAFGVFVWPTPWTFIHIGGYRIVRLNRLTGSAELVHVEPASARLPWAKCSGVDLAVDWIAVPFTLLGMFSVFVWIPWLAVRAYRKGKASGSEKSSV